MSQVSAPGERRWDAVVVGAGVAGLVAARELATAGLRTLVLDGRDAPGGSVRGHTVAGLSLDAGAESFATRGGVVAGLLDELGLTDRVRPPQPHGSWVHLPSGDGPLPRTGLLGIPSEPGASDVRRTLGVLGSWRARLDLVLPARVGAGATTLGGLVRARMGRRVLDRLVRPIVGGVHAADPDDLAVDAVAPGLPAALRSSGGSLARAVAQVRAAAPAGSAILGVSGGMHVLVDALVAELTGLGAEVRTYSKVTAVERVAGGRDDDGTPAADAEPAGGAARWRVTVAGRPAGADPVQLVADRLVLATPATAELLGAAASRGAAATGAAGPTTEEPPAGAAVAPHAGTGSPQLDAGAAVTLVTLVLDEPALDAAPRGTGVLVTPAATDVRAKALTHATAKWGWLADAAGPGRHVVRLSFGRAGDDTPLPAERDALVDLALRDASTLLGVPLRRESLVGHAVVRWTEALPRPSAAHQEAVAHVREQVAALPGLAVCGAWAAGNGLASVVPDARRAAQSLL
ncbi:FAD-dependent oxidoreductase [Cellulomonas sp.]|uniref:protoporphyrinogen/coproporphyrinogen oxidase n=1 Tax=Cellulomonas sp. TaxID=40001 RepID=UPI001B20DD07|nr:FAD-dependent oxidoreductase [Cellulomonas sp.]MBO9554561.1 FAD-dependent oxidoreductase [Cellulomonas sp.]